MSSNKSVRTKSNQEFSNERKVKKASKGTRMLFLQEAYPKRFFIHQDSRSL